MPKLIGPPTTRFNLYDANAQEATYIILHYNYAPKSRLKYAIGRKIKPADWDFQKQRAKVGKRYSEYTYLNAYLDDLSDACLDIYRKNNNGKITTTKFKESLKIFLGEEVPVPEQDGPKPPADFLAFVNQYCEDRKKQPNAKKGTIRNLFKVKALLTLYAKERKKQIPFSALNSQFFDDLRNWLFAPPRSLSSNYASRLAVFVKQFAKKAEENGYLENRSYLRFKIAKTPVSKIALSFKDLDILKNLDLSESPHLEKSRDLFLIGAFTGLRYSDFIRISPQHIQTHKGGQFIGITAQKTNQMVYIPLHPALDEVLKKYNYKAPKVSNQKMNDHLKEIGVLAGFDQEIIINVNKGGVRTEEVVKKWEKMATHVARRSFATNYYEKYPEMIDSIMKITGHTTEKMFREYIITDKIDSALRLSSAILGK